MHDDETPAGARRDSDAPDEVDRSVRREAVHDDDLPADTGRPGRSADAT